MTSKVLVWAAGTATAAALVTPATAAAAPSCAAESLSPSTSAPETCVLQGYPGWVPQTIAITLPNASGRLETPWTPGGIPVARQDAATHPGTYIGALQPAE